MHRYIIAILLVALLYPAVVFGAPAPVSETGQTVSYVTGDDGNLKPGVAWPSPRFTDSGNGSVTDNLTGLIWLKNANCTDSVGGKAPSSGLVWADALTWSNSLASGKCGLSDNSAAGDWRLPSKQELESLVDLSQYSPALPSGHPFTNVQAVNDWSSSTYASYTASAWFVGMDGGNVGYLNKASNGYVWPVRGGQSGSLGNLVILKNGSGSGSVTANFGIISWGGSTGSASYLSGTPVTLTATPDSGNSFANWSGCDSTSGNTCTVAVSATRNVTATFNDTQAPVISSFTIPTASTASTVSVTLNAIDNVGVAYWCLTESNTAADCSWQTNKPTSYLFNSDGNKTLYAFVKDGAGNVSTGLSQSFTITAQPLTFSTTSINNAIMGTAYNATLTATGGIGAITYSVPPNVLPTGLSLSSTGIISGTPTTRVLTATFTVTATDGGGHSTPQNFTMRVIDPNYRKLALDSTSWSVAKGGASSWINIKLVNDEGVQASIAGANDIDLATSCSANGIFGDGRAWDVYLVTMSTSGSARFLYKDTIAENCTLTVAGSPGTAGEAWATDSHTITVTGNQLSAGLALASSSYTATYSQSVTISGTLKNSQTNAALNGRGVSVSLLSPAGSTVGSVPATTTASDGSFTFTISNSALDRAGDWTATVTFAGDSDYSQVGQQATLHIGKATTGLTLNPTAPTVSPTGTITLQGLLSVNTQNAVNPTGLQLSISMQDPNGVSHPVTPTTTVDGTGHYTATFNQFNNVTGTWTITAAFNGTDSLVSSQAPNAVLSVQAASGYALLIQGELSGNSTPNYTASFDKIYGQLIQRSFDPNNIYRIGPDIGHKNVNAQTSIKSVRDAFYTWAANRIGQQGAAPLFIIMIGHGWTAGEFYVGDDSNYVTPANLNLWLSDLETTLSSGKGISLKSVIVDGACFSGSIIPTLEKVGRTIVTSASSTKTAVQGPPPSPTALVQTSLGDQFTDTFLDNLARPTTNTHLIDAFRNAAASINAISPQTPLFNDTGTGPGKILAQLDRNDGNASAGILLGEAHSAGDVSWTGIIPTTTVMQGTLPPLYVQTSDPTKTDVVWAMVKRPSDSMQGSGSGQVDMNLPKLIGQYVAGDGKWEFPLALNPTMGDIFKDAGQYSVVFYAMSPPDIPGGDDIMLTPQVATIYVNTATNQAPAQPVLQLPVPDGSAAVQDPYILFEWSAAADPDNDPVTYTLDICNNSGCTGTPLKRYEQLPQEGTWLDTSLETQANGTLLFNAGTTYYWQVTAIDNKGMETASAPGHFTYSPQNGLPGVVIGYLKNAASGSPIGGATITVGNRTATTFTNGAFIMVLLPGSYNVSVTAATGYQLKSIPLVIVTAGNVKDASMALTAATVTVKPGDCNRDGHVGISEAESAINMFLGLKAPLACVDLDGNNSVSISEVQTVINLFLGL